MNNFPRWEELSDSTGELADAYRAMQDYIELVEANVWALLDDLGELYDESSGYYRMQVWVDADLVDALKGVLKPRNATPEYYEIKDDLYPSRPPG